MRVFRWLKSAASVLVAALVLAQAPSACQAGIEVPVYDVTGKSNIDQNFENQGKWLQTTYNLPNIVLPNGTTSTTVLPQVERFVTQFSSASGGTVNGLYLPFSSSGTPGVSYAISGGGTGVGVHTALTNFGALGAGTLGSTSGSAFTPWDNKAKRTVNFEVKRNNNVVTFTADSRTWTSNAADYYKEANAIEFRIRSSNPSGDNYNTISYEDLKLTDDNNTNKSLEDVEAEEGQTTIVLLEGLEGNFTLSGKFKYDPNGNGASGWNSQIKFLALPGTSGAPVVPEPASMAIFGLLGGSLGYARWRRRKNRS